MSSKSMEESAAPGTDVVSIELTPKNARQAEKLPDTTTAQLPLPTNPPAKEVDWWIWEMGALFLSAVTIVCMSVFLLKFDGKPAPPWSYSRKDGVPSNKLSQLAKASRLNFAAILELFSKTSSILLALPLVKAVGKLSWLWFMGKHDRKLADFAVFDSAVKKNLKATAQLMWMVKGKHFVFFGAVAVLGLELLSFFIQQLVSLPVGYWPDNPHQISTNNPAWLSFNKTLTAYQNGTIQTFEIPPELQMARIANSTVYVPDYGEAPYYDVDLEMKSNIWAGLFSEDDLFGWSIPQYYCSTGNCTWTNYASLGVCSRCADLTAKLNTSCNAHAADLNNATGCDIKLPNGFALGGPRGERNHLLAASTENAPLVYGNYTNPLAVIQSIWANDTSIFVIQSTQVIATECVLIPCIIKYQSSLVNNSADLAKSGQNGIPYYEFVDSIYDNYTFEATNSSASSGITIDFSSKAGPSDPTKYYMSGPAYIGLTYYLQSMFNGFVTTDGKAASYTGDNITRPGKGHPDDVMQSLYAPFSCTDIYGNLEYNKVSCSIESAAIAMTTTIRDDSFYPLDFSQYYALGTTAYPKPTVDVTWLWIIPVIAMWLLCAILAFGTILKTRRAGVGGMALDPLTLIFLDLENKEVSGEQNNSLPWYHSKDEAKKRAQQMQVRLRLSDRKVSFVQGPEQRES